MKPSANVPFVGCKSDGQVGPQDAPTGAPKSISISPQLAHSFAYYKAAEGVGVLAPRGWYCFGTYGSDGSNLYVTPMPLNSADLFSGSWKGISGYAIQLSVSNGDTSGRFQVAEIIARVFPAHRDFVRRVIAQEPATSFQYGPYVADKLAYKSTETVEYVTPPNTEGLGTRAFLVKDGDAINGVAILTGEELSLTHLSARLRPEMSDLLPAIIGQVERDVSEADNSPTEAQGSAWAQEPTQDPAGCLQATAHTGGPCKVTYPNGLSARTFADGTTWIDIKGEYRFQVGKAFGTITGNFMDTVIIKTPQAPDIIQAPQFEKLSIYGDCAENTYIIWGLLFTDPNGYFTIDGGGPEDVKRRVMPNTPMATVFKFACKK
jgi:hypothetical protein